VNRILEDLVRCVKPRWMKVAADYVFGRHTHGSEPRVPFPAEEALTFPGAGVSPACVVPSRISVCGGIGERRLLSGSHAVVVPPPARSNRVSPRVQCGH